MTVRLLFLFCGFSVFSQELTWKEIQSDINYLNSQRYLFERVEIWKEETIMESVTMDSIVIKDFQKPEKARLDIYNDGAYNPKVTSIPLKQIDSVSNEDYVINLYVSELEPPIYSFMYTEIDLFQGNEHILYFVIERFRRIVEYYK